MSFYVVDIEADNRTPATGSIVCFGAVKVTDPIVDHFYGQTAPISELWKPEALAISGIAREQHEKFAFPELVMLEFNNWVINTNKAGRPVFISDNLAFDWMWIACYFDKYNIENPFGYSGRRIGDLYCGLVKDAYAKWKHLRITKHDHNPVNDAKANAEALLYMKNEMGLDINFK